LRASSALRGAGGPAGGRASTNAAGALVAVPSRATVTLGVNNEQSFILSLAAILTGIGLRHWNRVDGSKCEHCLQQWSAELHLGQLPLKSTPGGSAVEQL